MNEERRDGHSALHMVDGELVKVDPHPRQGLRPGLPPLPERMQVLRVSEKGYPVPWFVPWVGGKPNFRLADSNKVLEALDRKVCWICGQPMGKYMTFVAGPIAALNRSSSEPASHRDCATFAATACPFLILPKAKRQEEAGETPRGLIEDNPGGCVVWTTCDFRVATIKQQMVIGMGDPVHVNFYSEGKLLDHAGAATLLASARDRLKAIVSEHLHPSVDNMYLGALRYLPKEVQG